MSLIKGFKQGFTIWAVSVLLMLSDQVSACVVCIPLPQQTVADDLLNAKVVVLARENPEQPYSYATVEVLKGNPSEYPIKLFLDSTTRQRLAIHPDRAVVLVLRDATPVTSPAFWTSNASASSTSAGTWHSLGFVDEKYEALLRHILNQKRWEGRVGQQDRIDFFMPYLADTDNAIRELAYLEVGRAPYEIILKADEFVPPEQLRTFLANQKYLEWHPLYILLLGANASPEEAQEVRAAMAMRARLDLTINLSAWASALIEVDGEAAIDWLETEYIQAPNRDPQAVLEIVKAFSVQGARPGSELRERIAHSYGLLIGTHPSLAGWAARDLTAWNDWRFADALAEVRKTQLELDGATIFSINYYIGRARSSRKD